MGEVIQIFNETLWVQCEECGGLSFSISAEFKDENWYFSKIVCLGCDGEIPVKLTPIFPPEETPE